MNKKTWSDIAIAIIISYVLGIIILPQRFWLFNTTFVDYSDSLLSYAGAFYFTNGLLHGGIQLWDRYDQMPMTFFYLNFAMYKFSNVLTALIYIPLSWFSHAPAELFGKVFSFVFIFSAMCVRAVGVYLLLDLFVRRRWILIAGTVYGIVMLSPQFLMGLSTNIIYSLFPLMMYFLLRFFDEFQFRHLFWFLATWTYCISTDLFCGLGYLYQGTHFVILPGLVWMVIRHKAKFKDLTWFKITREHWIKIGMLIVLTLVMVGPGLYMLKAHKQDYEFGLDQSRMKNPFSIKQYFARPAGWSPQEQFFTRMVDHTENLWSLNWLYVGGICIFFTLFGLCTLKDSRRWILLGAIVLFFAINCPRDSTGIGALAHWINALTNPIKFLPRSYHMACSLLLPFLLLPLCVAGFERFMDDKKGLGLRVTWALFFGVGAMVFGIVPFEARKTLLIMTFLLLVLSLLPQKRRVITIVLLVMLFSVDAWAMSKYLKGMINTILVVPRPILARPDLGLVSMEYQNPNILPVRHFSSLQQHSGVDTYLFESCTNMPGLMFRYTNFLRYYQRISNYLPRHSSFAQWVNDSGRMYNYVQAIPTMMYLADKVAVDDTAHTLQVTALSDAPKVELTKAQFRSSQITFRQEKEYVLASFPMPKDLPNYYATVILSPDEFLFALSINDQSYTAAQGALIRPQTFDVNNVRDGYVSVALPLDVDRKSLRVEFTYPKVPLLGLRGVFLNHMDAFGFTYKAERDGWLILHEPYDTKWQVSLDNAPANVYKAQNSFIAMKVKEGEHRILLKYWPHHPIRFFLAVSIIVSMLSLIWILLGAVRERAR